MSHLDQSRPEPVMANADESDQPPATPQPPSKPDGLPAIRCYPCDIPIQSIADARQRLAMVDGFGDDLREIAGQIGAMKREVLEAAGVYDVAACLLPGYEEALLKEVPPPAAWGDEWMIDFIVTGSYFAHGSLHEQLDRFAAFVRLPPPDVREVKDCIDAAISAALIVRVTDVLPNLVEVESKLWAAYRAYKSLRDSIAGALDRWEAEQLLHAGRQIDLGHGPFDPNPRPQMSANPQRAAVDSVQVNVTPSIEATGTSDGPEASAGPSDAGMTPPQDPLPLPGDLRLEPSSGNDPVDVGCPNLVTSRYLDRPETVPSDLWAALADLRVLLGMADRILNQVQEDRQSSGVALLALEYRQLLPQLALSRRPAALRLHEKVRDLCANLRHGCQGLTLPECPGPSLDYENSAPWQVRRSLRDDVPRFRTWLGEVEVRVRAWSESLTQKNDPPSIPRKRLALEERKAPKSKCRVNLYELIRQAKRKGEGVGRRAARLRADKDLAALAIQAGFEEGITEDTVKSADQFDKDRRKRKDPAQK